MLRLAFALALEAAAAEAIPRRLSKVSVLQVARDAAPGGAPGAAPGAAPAAAPAGAPAGPADKWGADTHAEEFGSEYAHHDRKNLREPHVGDAAWQNEMHKNVGDFDLGKDYVTDGRSPARNQFQLFSAAAPCHAMAAALAVAVGVAHAF